MSEIMKIINERESKKKKKRHEEAKDRRKLK